MKVVKLAQSLCFACLILCGGQSIAGTQTGKIETLTVRSSDGLIAVVLSGPAKSGSPACATYSYWLIKNEGSTTGKQLYAMLLAAHLASRSVTIVGENTCTRWPDGEDVLSVVLTP